MTQSDYEDKMDEMDKDEDELDDHELRGGCSDDDLDLDGDIICHLDDDDDDLDDLDDIDEDDEYDEGDYYLDDEDDEDE